MILRYIVTSCGMNIATPKKKNTVMLLYCEAALLSHYNCTFTNEDATTSSIITGMIINGTTSMTRD